MGLDVYLHHCKDRAAARAAEKQAEAKTDALWEGRTYDSLSEAERQDISARSNQIRSELGCDDWGQHKSVQEIDLPSARYPEHLFRIGYFRSSYNSGGINHVLSNLGLPDLYHMMGVPDGEYEVHHDWAVCLQNIDETIASYQAHLSKPIGKFTVMELRQPINRVGSAEQALRLFEHELGNRDSTDSMFDGYSNAHGEFYLGGLRVHALIPSSEKWTSMYAIVAKEETEEGDFYLQALEIMRETCEHVLKQDDPQNYYMRWSG